MAGSSYSKVIEKRGPGAVGGNLSIKVSNPMNSASTALIRCACFGAAPVFPRNLVTVKGRHFGRPLFAEIDQQELRETKARLAPAAVGHEAHPHEAQDHHGPGGGLRYRGHRCYSAGGRAIRPKEGRSEK